MSPNNIVTDTITSVMSCQNERNFVKEAVNYGSSFLVTGISGTRNTDVEVVAV